MVRSSQKYVLAAASVVAGAAGTGAADAATLVSRSNGAAPVTFRANSSPSTPQTLGTFDPSGAGLNTITVQGGTQNPISDSTPKLYFRSDNVGAFIATRDGTFNGSDQDFVASFATLPDTLGDSNTGQYLSKGTSSLFSTTPSYGMTSFLDGTVTRFGYFQGSFDAAPADEGAPTFTLLDYGTIEADGPAGVPEPQTWAMLAGGFAAMGAALRRRRRDLVAA